MLDVSRKIRVSANPGLISQYCYDFLAQIIQIADSSPDISLTSLWLKVNNTNSEINTLQSKGAGEENVYVCIHVCEWEEKESHGDVSRSAAGVLW